MDQSVFELILRKQINVHKKNSGQVIKAKAGCLITINIRNEKNGKI
jgi:hypothetical protein